MVLVFGADERLLASYPATIGSEQTPSPSGNSAIERIARNPNYTYDPEKNFQQYQNTETLVLPPGPNGPCRDDLDRAIEADLRHSRYARNFEGY